MNALPLAEVKSHLSAVLDDVRRTHEHVVITRNGRPEAVLLAIDDFEAMEETLTILSTPGLIDKLDRAAAEIDNGNYVTGEELNERYLGNRG